MKAPPTTLPAALPYRNHGLTGERRLAGEVLLAAVEDLRKGNLQARLFIDSDTFVFWCRVAGLHPEWLRRSHSGIPPRAAPNSPLLDVIDHSILQADGGALSAVILAEILHQ